MNNFDKNEIIIYNKEDIMIMFKCKSDKALKILKFLYSINEAIKIGREYYIEKNNLMQFLNDYKGDNISI